MLKWLKSFMSKPHPEPHYRITHSTDLTPDDIRKKMEKEMRDVKVRINRLYEEVGLQGRQR